MQKKTKRAIQQATSIRGTVASSTTQNVVTVGTTTALFIAAIMSWLRREFPEQVFWEPEKDLVVGGIVATLVTAWLSRIVAFLRDPTKAARSASVWGGRCIVLFLALGVGASGCVGLTPAVGGKAKVTTHFSNVGDDYRYDSEVIAPAGTDIAGLNAMEAGIDEDGDWKIAVSQDAAADTTVQAEMLAEISAMQIQAYRDAFSTVLNSLAPILGQHLDAKIRAKEIEALTERESE